jgi:hypothetical protein
VVNTNVERGYPLRVIYCSKVTPPGEESFDETLRRFFSATERDNPVEDVNIIENDPPTGVDTQRDTNTNENANPVEDVNLIEESNPFEDVNLIEESNSFEDTNTIDVETLVEKPVTKKAIVSTPMPCSTSMANKRKVVDSSINSAKKSALKVHLNDN